jgi:hypothetical protein
MNYSQVEADRGVQEVHSQNLIRQSVHDEAMILGFTYQCLMEWFDRFYRLPLESRNLSPTRRAPF